jgi:hypothetical protein
MPDFVGTLDRDRLITVRTLGWQRMRMNGRLAL